MNVKKAQRLIHDVQTRPEDPNTGMLANELLDQFHEGYPVQHLRALLRSQDQAVTKIGMWIASELGAKASPLLDDTMLLLNHADKSVRFYAVDSMLSCAAAQNSPGLAFVVQMLGDKEEAVRWKAMDFLSRASTEQLQAALCHFRATDDQSRHIHGLQFLLGENSANAEEVLCLIQSQDDLLQRYGVVAAVRMALDDIQPLLHASSMVSSDARQFAMDMLKMVRMEKTRKRRRIK
jgi:HEAT repeat protein